MPIYEYKCKNCSIIFEIFQKKIDDLPPEKCPNCKKIKKLEKIISISSFVLKGNGWYKTSSKK